MSCSHKEVIKSRLACIENGWIDKYPELTAFCADCGWIIRLKDMKAVNEYRKVKVQNTPFVLDSTLANDIIAYVTFMKYLSSKEFAVMDAMRDPDVSSTLEDFHLNICRALGNKIREDIKHYESIQQEARGQSGAKAP